jgi:hypothetical protein
MDIKIILPLGRREIKYSRFLVITRYRASTQRSAAVQPNVRRALKACGINLPLPMLENDDVARSGSRCFFVIVTGVSIPAAPLANAMCVISTASLFAKTAKDVDILLNIFNIFQASTVEKL